VKLVISFTDFCRIVAIHGLGSGRIGTFTSTKGDDLWLRDFLPKHQLVAPMNPRISTFGYDMSVAFGASAPQIHNVAEKLLKDLQYMRQQSGNTEIPIVIIAHSLGGFVVKQVCR
jgi:hypothetical protein